MPISKDPIAFTEAMADVLYLSDESLAMSYVYINRYHRFIRSSSATDLLDPYTLSLAAVSLSCKSTSSSRRLSLILAPAHALLHPPPAPPLKVPSTQYDCLRATLVRAELLLLRVLGFELRISTPLDFIERYTDRAMRDLREFAEDYDRWDLEERQEYGIANRMEIGLGRAVKVKALQACQHYQLTNLFPARAVSAGCLYLAMEGRGLKITDDSENWLDDVTSGKVDRDDFEEVLEVLRQSN